MEFAPAIVAKLSERAARYRELTEMISQPEVATSKVYPDLLREHGQLEPANRLAERLVELTARDAENRSVLDDSEEDAELKELAEEDQVEVTEALAALEQHMPELQASLADRGFEDAQLELALGFEGEDEEQLSGARAVEPKPDQIQRLFANAEGVDFYA